MYGHNSRGYEMLLRLTKTGTRSLRRGNACANKNRTHSSPSISVVTSSATGSMNPTWRSMLEGNTTLPEVLPAKTADTTELTPIETSAATNGALRPNVVDDSRSKNV